MGRSRQKNRGGGNKWKVKPNPNEGDRRNIGDDGYKLAVKENEAFESYYKAQHLIPESEWADFMEHLRKPLPSTIRVNGFKSESREIRKLLKSQYLPSLANVEIDGEELKPPTCLSWYPEELAWQIDLERKFIRKHEPLAKLHEFLVSETESGHITRQEAVSMIPPLFMDVKPHHKVLDMCAAPGSKTSQLIEMIHADEKIHSPEGFVVANDSDNKRCYLMTHQIKRLESPNFVVINHDASQLPNLWDHNTNDRKGFISYDRVLCDVPCSGDGTLRKNQDIWTKWKPNTGNNLHGLQRRILKRGMELLGVGGRLVYSTCSFNPVENEAVVADMLDMCKDTVHLVDVSTDLPDLKRMPGLSNWKIMNKDNEFFDKFQDVPDKNKMTYHQSLFPPAAEKLKRFNLNRCMRIMPHQQNTGGFFVAVFEKTSQLPWVKVNQPKNEDTHSANVEGTASANIEIKTHAGDKRKETEDTETNRPPQKKMKRGGFKEDPFIWLSKEHKVWPEIRDFYGLRETFRPDLLMVRSEEGKIRNIYYTSANIKNIATYSHNVKFINMGVKMFGRSDSPYVECGFRLAQDGIDTLYPYIEKRKVDISAEDLVTVLAGDNPLTTKISDVSRDNIEALEQGGCVFVCKASEKPDTPDCDLILTAWKGRLSCRCFLKKYDRSHYLRMFGHELKLNDKAGKSDAPSEEKPEEKMETGETEGEPTEKSNVEDTTAQTQSESKGKTEESDKKT